MNLNIQLIWIVFILYLKIDLEIIWLVGYTNLGTLGVRKDPPLDAEDFLACIFGGGKNVSAFKRPTKHFFNIES